MDRALVGSLIVAAASVTIHFLGHAISYGQLKNKVDVLWLAVFNHLGQNADAVTAEVNARKRRGRTSAKQV